MQAVQEMSHGVYDLNGGNYEYVAAYNKAISKSSNQFGGAGGNTDASTKPVNGIHFAYSKHPNSDKYVTAYSNSTYAYEAETFAEFTSGGKDVSHVGDGIHEVWVEAGRGWFSDFSFFISSSSFFARGRCLLGGQYFWYFFFN